MFKRTLLTILGAALLAGCSQAALNRAKHFFFEVPDETPAQAVAGQPPAAQEQPELVLPEPRYVSVHHPVLQRRCSDCHKTTGLMQVRDDFNEICKGCHPQYFSDDIEHGPIADGDCQSCHTMHRSKHKDLLIAPARVLCLDCHDPADELSEDAHGGPEADFCTRCHDSHFGAAPYLIGDQPTPAENPD
jgi:predicted CXXCH cytochrome family protein